MSSETDFKTLPPSTVGSHEIPPAYLSQPIVVHTTAPPAVQYKQQESDPLLLTSRQPPDYIWLSIFSIVCCFWPIGLFALYKSLQVSNHFDKGRYAEAMESSREAKKYNNIAILVGIVIQVVIWVCCILIPGVIVGIVAGVANSD